MNWALWHKWHRTIGIITALFVLLLSVTGILLNHTDQLDLNELYVQNETVLDLYDIQVKRPPTAYKTDGIWITRFGDRLYFNGKELNQRSESLRGAIALNEILVIAADNKLLLLSRDAEIIEKLTATEGVPAGIKKIGISVANELVIKTAHGNYIVDPDRLEWKEHDGMEINWSDSSVMPKDLHKQLLKLYRGKGLSIERVLLDLHSGRIFGSFGEYFIDIVAILFIFLALSGSWMWLRHMWR